MPEGRIKIYGASWCIECKRVKKFLGGHMVEFDWVDIEHDPEAMAFVEVVNQGKQVVPTMVLADGSTLVGPSDGELAQKLGLPKEPRAPFYDLVVVGGGPAGLTAAIYAAREGLETLVLEKGALGGQAAITEWIENYPGFPEGVGGMDLSRRMAEQAQRFGVQMEFAEAQALEQHGRYRLVRADAGDYCAWGVLIATGSSYRRLGAPGEGRLIGRGVHYCATCDGPFYKDQELLVIGGGNSAAEEGFFLTKFASRVTLVVRRGELRASQILKEKIQSSPKMGVLYHTEVKEFRGEKRLESVLLRNNQTGEEREVRPGGVFVFIGLDPNSQWLKGTLELDQYGFIVTGRTLQTSVPGGLRRWGCAGRQHQAGGQRRRRGRHRGPHYAGLPKGELRDRMADLTRVLVLGGGFAGINAAGGPGLAAEPLLPAKHGPVRGGPKEPQKVWRLSGDPTEG